MFVYFFFFTSFNDSVLFLFECNSISGSHWKTKTKPFSRGVEKKQYVIIIIIWNNEISMITKEVQKKTRPMHGMHSMQWSERKIIISGYRRRNDMERSFNSNMHTTCSLFFPSFVLFLFYVRRVDCTLYIHIVIGAVYGLEHCCSQQRPTMAKQHGKQRGNDDCLVRIYVRLCVCTVHACVSPSIGVSSWWANSMLHSVVAHRTDRGQKHTHTFIQHTE